MPDQTIRFDSSDLEADSIRFQVLTGAVRASPIRVRFLNWVSREFLSFLQNGPQDTDFEYLGNLRSDVTKIRLGSLILSILAVCA